MLTKAFKWSGNWGLAQPSARSHPKAHRPWESTIPEPPAFFVPYEEPQREEEE